MFRLMCITAHPDDEAANFGGSLRLYHDRNVETCVVCLTPGQAATHRGPARNDQELAALRRNEFAASCEILKISRGVVLDYPDANLYRQHLYHVACDVTLHIRQFRPQVILTFGPEGGVTAHQDHSLASIFVSLAFQWAGQSNRYPDQFANGLQPYRPQKLYYATMDSILPERQPVALPPATTVIDIGEHLETKIAAFQAHLTQQPLWSRVESRLRLYGSKEMFHLAASTGLGSVEPEHDLFAGVNE